MNSLLFDYYEWKLRKYFPYLKFPLNKYAFHYYSLLLEIIELNEEKKEIINNPNIDRKDKERLINKINSQIDGLIYTRVEKAPQHQNSSSIFDYIAEQYKKYVNQNGEIRNG